MTKEQIKYLVESYQKDTGSGKALAKSVFYDLDNSIVFRTNNEFVFFDWDKEFIHCISTNKNNNVKDETPFCVFSSGFEHLQFLEANLDMDGLLSAISGMFGSLISADNQNIIKDWAEKIPVHPKNPNVGLDYYKQEPVSISNIPVTEKMKETEKASGYKESVSNAIKVFNTFDDAIGNIKDGDAIFINSGGIIDSDIVIDAKYVYINCNHTKTTGTITLNDSGILYNLNIIAIKNEDKSDVKNGTKLINAKGDMISLDNVNVYGEDNASIRNPISIHSKEILIENSCFNGHDNIYNIIESAYGTAKVKKATINKCNFASGCAVNNYVSFYDFEDEAEVIFENCIFDCPKDVNAIRISNLSNAKNVTITIKNCRYRGMDGQYAGLILFQNNTGDQDFSNITLRIINLQSIDRTKTYRSNGEGADRIWYTYQTDVGPNVIFA